MPTLAKPNLASRHDQRRDDEERCRREVPGHRELAGRNERLEPPFTVTRLPGSRPPSVSPEPSGSTRTFAPGGPEHPLRVVARRVALDHRRLAVGHEAREEQA